MAMTGNPTDTVIDLADCIARETRRYCELLPRPISPFRWSMDYSLHKTTRRVARRAAATNSRGQGRASSWTRVTIQALGTREDYEDRR